MITYNSNCSVAEIGAGHSLYLAIEEIKQELMYNRNAGYCCDTKFNDVALTIYKDSNENDITLIYNLKCQLRREGL